MNVICEEMKKLGVPLTKFTVLQEKDGVIVARIAGGESSCILKCFLKEEFRREISNYRLLASLGIPTIRVIAATDSALLLEDIAESPSQRLGIPEDMDDPEIARKIAVWYKRLHREGDDYVRLYGEGLYDESDFFTLDNIDRIMEKTETQNAPAWKALKEDYAAIRRLLQMTQRTLTYNDFYYTNLIAARDKSSALMFDYNLLGKGYAYGDVRNVLSSLSPEAGEAFLDEYGGFDPDEKLLDDVVCTVVTLHLACQRKTFPVWARAMLEELDRGFIEKLERLRRIL